MNRKCIKLLSLFTVICIAASLAVTPAGVVAQNDTAISGYDPLLTKEYSFSDMDDVRDSFTCYSYKTGEIFGTYKTDENGNFVLDSNNKKIPIHAADGNPLHKGIDPALAWQIDTATGGIIRRGSGDYKGGRATNGSSMLYFNDSYGEFEIEFEYCFSSASAASYKWAGVGFGAEKLGDCFQLDSYFAVVEQEGTVRLHMKGDVALARINQGANTAYQTAVKDNLAANTATWHNLRVSVTDGRCHISYDGNTPLSYDVNTDAGYIYIYSNTEGMKFRNIKLSTPLIGTTVVEDANGKYNVEVWPEEYEVEAQGLSSVSNIKRGSKSFSFDTAVNGDSVGLSVTFPSEGGIRLSGERSGFFEPDSEKTITYNVTDNGIELSAGNEKALFAYSADGWKLLTYKNGEPSVAFGSDNLLFGYKADGSLGRIKYALPIAEGELFYGLGERYNAVNQNGYTVTLWNHDTTYHAASEDGDKTDSYANVPLIHSTAGYTLFFNSTYSAEADIGYTNSKSCQFDFNGDILDVYIWNGTPAENTAAYTSVTGKPFVAPEWAYGYWAGAPKAVYTDQNGDSQVKTEDVITVLQNIVSQYDSLGVKPAALYSEGTYIDNWTSTFPLLTDKGINALSWNRCSISYEKMIKSLDVSVTRLPLIRLSSDPLQYFANSHYAYIDYSNPLSKQLVKNLYSDMVNAGLRGLMVDMGEYIYEDTAFYNGKNGDEMHNLYSYYYGKTINEAFTEMLGNDFVLFERSGSAGSQAHSILFGGDQTGRWYGLRQQLNGLLTSSASGYSLYGADIGGFYKEPTDELYSRWVQFSAFSPIMREHGSEGEKDLPWGYGDAAQENFVKYYQVREALKGYIYSCALESGKTGVPITQTLAFAYPDQTELHSVVDEYMFLDNLLVAPVVTEGTTERKVALPEGKWYDFYSGSELSGGKTVTAAAPTDKIPVYIASGAMIPLMLSEKLSVTESGDKAVMLLTPPEESESAVINKEENTALNYRLSLLNDKSFEFEKPDGDGIKTVLVYGFKATNVCVNGAELAAVTDSSETGFTVKDGNTVIYLSSDGAANIEIFGAGIKRESNIVKISPKNIAELSELTCYSVPGNNNITDTDSTGNALFKEVAVSDIWSVPYPGVIERQSISKYASTSGRKGASSLYFDQRLTDFELNMSYCYNGANSTWRWIAVGFGAENIGDTYYDDSYIAYVEQEGTVRVLSNYNTPNQESYLLQKDELQEYTDSITAEPDLWHDFTLRVQGNTVTVGYDGNEYSCTVKNNSGGLIYLHCFTNDIRFRDITIADLSQSAYYGDYDRFAIDCSKTDGGSIICENPYAVAGQTVEFDVSCETGYTTNKLIKLTGHNGNDYIFAELQPDQNGKYSFTVPKHPVSLSAEFYISGDATADGNLDIRDLIRMKKYLAKSYSLINVSAVDINTDKTVDTGDLASLKKLFL